MKKIIIVFSLLTLMILDVFYIQTACADDNKPSGNVGNINVSVNVVARKATDTINDFDYSVLNTSEALAENQMVASDNGIVKGIETQSALPNHPNIFTQIINEIHNLWSRIF